MWEAGWYPDEEQQGMLRYWDGSGWTEVWAPLHPPPVEPPPLEPPPVSNADPGSVVSRPEPKLIRSPWEAEEVAAEWLRWFGFDDAKSTGVGPDGGVDVRGKALVAQVKMHMVPIGRPDLQRLHGIAVTEGAVSVFFSLTDYTRDAKEWADQVRMALFRFSQVGEAEPVNGYAEVLAQRAEQRQPRPASQRTPMWGLPIGCSDDMAHQKLKPKRMGLRQHDQVLWVRQAWLPVASLKYDFSYIGNRGRRVEEEFGQTRVAIELVSRCVIAIPEASGAMLQVPPAALTIRPQWSSRTLAEQVTAEWVHFLELQQPAAQQRSWYMLSSLGVPAGATRLRVTDEGTILLPFFAALLRTPTGNRVSVVEGVAGTPHAQLGSILTKEAPHLLDQLSAARPVVG